ncbi:MAG: ABC transporter permease [Chloroflexi bacterium]|nr:ABC transporter permease [Chloroflexota bacterium]
MAAFIIRRLMWLPVVLFVVSVITLFLGLVIPGNPVQIMLGLKANPETVARITHEYGLDQPFYQQYINYISNALQGNFGYGLVKYRDQPVGTIIAERLPVTLQLNFLALIVGSLIGIPLGLIAGLNRNSILDYLIRNVSLIALATPLLFLLPFLSFIFSRRHDFGISLGNVQLSIGPFLPMVGGRWDGIFSTKIVLPVFIESLGFIAVLARQMRAGMIEVLGQDYVRTARAKGLRERIVLVRHAMRNALIPIATILGLSLGGLVEGSFLVILALTLLVAVTYVFANMFIDFLYPFLDPRIRRPG